MARATMTAANHQGDQTGPMTDTAGDVVVHLMRAAGWAEAQAAGFVSSDSLVSDGFLHCSRPDQIAGVANRFYAGANDLVLLIVPVVALGPTLRWEPPAHPDGSLVGDADARDLFPHVYATIDVAAVRAVVSFEPGVDGLFTTPVLV
jgi:uncharacterized protein (DUF952 family)